MDNEYTLTLARIDDSIMRIPDRLSTPQGEAIRSEFARIFGLAIAGHEYKELYLKLPFQVSLLTDPVLYVVAGGLLVLDHPTRSSASEFAFGERSHVVDLDKRCSIYDGRHPRIIACARKHEKIAVGWMYNRLMDFHGPFARATA